MYILSPLKQKFMKIVKISCKCKIVILFISLCYSTEYYVSSTGHIENTGSYSSPFLNIQQAADIMQAGDICYIRQGVYHEQVLMDNRDGTLDNPIVFTS